jgi:hypothetical protein
VTLSNHNYSAAYYHTRVGTASVPEFPEEANRRVLHKLPRGLDRRLHVKDEEARAAMQVRKLQNKKTTAHVNSLLGKLETLNPQPEGRSAKRRGKARLNKRPRPQIERLSLEDLSSLCGVPFEFD